jgi:TetR/AcrR family transcriptional regulator, mexJK operon transcriptional repressor
VDRSMSTTARQVERSKPSGEADVSRTARKRRAIIKAATEVFLQHGYVGASMDEVAARAAVSKQTVYKQFDDKKHLFAEIILGTTTQGLDTLAQSYANTLDEVTDVRQAFRELARRLLDTLMRPDFLQLRRLVLAEADRFPEISGAWFEDAFHRALVLLGEAMTRLADRGMLRELPDPTLAAYHFAGLVMYKPMNQAMFAGAEARPAVNEFDHIADQAADVFLAAYGRP